MWKFKYSEHGSTALELNYLFPVTRQHYEILAMFQDQEEKIKKKKKKMGMTPKLHSTCMYMGDPRTCAIFILEWGSNWGSSGFSIIKITVVHQERMSLASTAVLA